MMFKRPNDAKVGDTVAVYRWNGSYSRKVTFATVTKVSPRKITLDNGEAFKTSDWHVWGEKPTYRAGVELVDETTGRQLQKNIDEEATCKTLALEANEVLSKVEIDRFRRYASGWRRVDLKNAIADRKQAMLAAVAEFDRITAALEEM
jgi:hypothetical protein